MKEKIHIAPIIEGTAIDHLAPASAMRIASVLDIGSQPFTIASNVQSKKMGRKDLLFIEGKKLSKNEVDKIALLGKGATINIIHNGKVVKKERIDYPEKVEGIMKCINPNCITNHENIATKFSIQKKPLKATCFYCERRMSERDITKAVK